MASRERRVMRGQVAAVYALRLLGCFNFGEACEIVGICRTVMRHYILPEWRSPPARLPIRQKDMTREQFYTYRKFTMTLGRAAADDELRRRYPHAATAANQQETVNG